ncbi:MAG: SDR family oxidoreductase [Caldilineaceae bacterium]|nr:SDR family oxidoreductase [Caldilineaceae bacterium]MBP8110522.1 SDR family oxidoreductase [Caldilineaceae bacterium]MBP8123798.1 SDR family oxidoreductase [Caldilineaceae bacterium]MBP9073591.1 SDR family oxidoreductase [Caldilineaceae bacterium]
MTPPQKILVTGATGYVGGRLVPRLLEAGYAVRVLVRSARRLQGREWTDQVEVIRGDVFQPESLAPALSGIDAAYYLIHSMSDSADFTHRDNLAAENFATAAKAANVGRIIYLGGLGAADAELSPHLRSRQQTGDALRRAGVPVTEFRAAVIVGSGSVSFEIVRNLAERFPVMLFPHWVFTPTQPIAIRNVLEYLIAALEVPESADRIIEIGGTDVLTYADMLTRYAKARNMTRRIFAAPLPRTLPTAWISWVTPIPPNIVRPLLQGLRNEVRVRDDTAQRLFPHIQLLDYETAVNLALARIRQGEVETLWSDAVFSSQGDIPPIYLTEEQGILLERRQLTIDAPAQAIYQVFTGLGGDRGWLILDWVWQLRGWLDRLAGGVGFRRGRRDADEVRVGDAIDFWRVEAVEEGRSLLLRAEMKMPGRGWLQFKATPQPDGRAHLVQTAFFAPKGLWGPIYWYALYPIHGLIFGNMVREIGRRAEQNGQ